MLDVGGKGRRDCLLIEFEEGEERPHEQNLELVKQNLERLYRAFDGKGEIQRKQVEMWAGDAFMVRRVSSQNASRVFAHKSDFEGYSDVIIDVSALPRSIYLSLIAKCIHLLSDESVENIGQSDVNLHVLVCENPKLDMSIEDVAPDDTADYVHHFRGDMEMEAISEKPKLLIPVLGESQAIQLHHIYALVNPEEVAPVLPWPSSDPRRGDQLVVEYRESLFDQWQVEPSNIVYAAENNPFEAYRQIFQVVHRYDQALKPIGGCRAAIAALSSKLLSLGALLAAYDLKAQAFSVSLAHVETRGYRLSDTSTGNATDMGWLQSLTLVGDFYASG